MERLTESDIITLRKLTMAMVMLRAYGLHEIGESGDFMALTSRCAHESTNGTLPMPALAEAGLLVLANAGEDRRGKARVVCEAGHQGCAHANPFDDGRVECDQEARALLRLYLIDPVKLADMEGAL